MPEHIEEDQAYANCFRFEPKTLKLCFFSFVTVGHGYTPQDVKNSGIFSQSCEKIENCL